MFSDTLYDVEVESGDVQAFNFDPDDEQAPHSPVVISFDPRFQLYEPLTFSDQTGLKVIAPAFGDFVQWCFERLRVTPVT